MPGMAAGENISQAFSVAASKASATNAAKAKAKGKADVAGEKKNKAKASGDIGVCKPEDFS